MPRECLFKIAEISGNELRVLEAQIERAIEENINPDDFKPFRKRIANLRGRFSGISILNVLEKRMDEYGPIPLNDDLLDYYNTHLVLNSRVRPSDMDLFNRKCDAYFLENRRFLMDGAKRYVQDYQIAISLGYEPCKEVASIEMPKVKKISRSAYHHKK